MQRKTIIHPIIAKYLDNLNIQQITENFTRPCKILFPEVFAKNIQNMKFFLDDEMIDYKIYYANKANKSNIFVQTALENYIWIDVSSRQELQDALYMWYDTDEILANGPKDTLFLDLCLQNNILVSVDSIWEIHKILNSTIPSSSKILLRICPPSDITHSRFGIGKKELFEHQDLIIKLSQKHNIYGLNFHIDSINPDDRKNMVKHIIDIRQKLTEIWVSVEQIGVWWGFGVKYIDDILENQNPREYPQSNRLYGLDMLWELLDSEIIPWLSFKKYLIESMTTLHIEPGKLLLDQCGICIHNIIDKKDNKVFIDGNMYSLWAIWQEMPQDPIRYWAKKTITNNITEYQIYGNLCLEADRIFSRKIYLSDNIQVWDSLIFINTATYFSDFSDSQPIKHNERQEIIVR